MSAEHGLGEFLPEAAAPEQLPPAPLRAADIDQLDALLVAISSRLHTLDDDIDQLRTLSVKAGNEYHRLSDQARVLRLRAAPTPARLSTHGRAAFEIADASAPIEIPEFVSAPRLRSRQRVADAAVVWLRRLPAELQKLRPAALPVAAVVAGFLLMPAILLMRGSTPRAVPPAMSEPSSAVVTSAAGAVPVPVTEAPMEPFAAPPAIPAPTKAPAPPPALARAPRPAAAAPALVQPAANNSRAGFEGSLQVQSIPAGATVFVNQKYVGETPLTLPRVRAGSNVVWVERSGYERWTSGVLVPTGEVTRVLVSLTKSTRPRH